jgi:hypothetical protein
MADFFDRVRYDRFHNSVVRAAAIPPTLLEDFLRGRADDVSL